MSPSVKWFSSFTPPVISITFSFICQQRKAAAYRLGQPHTLSRLVTLSCPNTVHLSQSNPGPGLPVSPLTPISSLGPLKEGGSSSDRTTLTAHQPEPDTFLKAELGCSQCSLLSLRSFLNMSFLLLVNMSTHFVELFCYHCSPFVQVIYSSWRIYSWLHLYVLPKTNSSDVTDGDDDLSVSHTLY